MRAILRRSRYSLNMSQPPADFGGRKPALFLDVDGTLVDIESHPDDVRANAGLIALLVDLAERLDGAVSLISGRSIGEIDRIFAPAQFPSAGSHGAELRMQDKDMTVAPAQFPETVLRRARSFADEREGLLVEKKSAGVALHYRRAPHLETACREFIADVMRELGPEFRLIDGKMVLEIAPRSHHKGEAIREMLQHPPFQGRRPVFVGDDVTDEDGFRIVNDLDGLSIRVGQGNTTAARFSLDDVSDVHDWLRAVAGRLE
jgi:trehalose 6-phosphate phosphatase